ncbi:hypothetical protein KDK88_08955, partial [bacterium]|nr:hypothetical protein [bacterium]
AALGYREGEAAALDNLAVALYLRGRYEASVEAHLRATRIYEELEMLPELAMSYGSLGYQMKRRDLPRAVDTMRRGLAIAERHRLQEPLGALYDNYGVLMEMKGEQDSAAWYFRRSLAIKEARRDSVGIPFSLNNLVGLHLQAGAIDSAAVLLRRSDAYRRRPSDAYGRLVNTVVWGDLHLRAGRPDSAAARYTAALAMPGAVEQGYLTSYCLEHLAQAQADRGDFEAAFHAQQRFAAQRDSLVDTETNARISDLELGYESERKDRELAESRLAVAARSRQVLLLGGALLALALVGAGILRDQFVKRRQLRRELALQERVRRAEVEQGVADAKLGIARELHDNIGAQLTFLISSVDNLAAGGHATPERLTELGSFGRGTLNELRQTVWAMKHEEEGLEALELRLQEIKRQAAGARQAVEVTVTREADAPDALSSVRLLNLVRIAQEAVQNALKHSGGTRVDVTLHAAAAALTLSVADDGEGAPAAGQGSGLQHMRERAAEIGGELRVEVGDGCVVTVSLPWESDSSLESDIRRMDAAPPRA